MLSTFWLAARVQTPLVQPIARAHIFEVRNLSIQACNVMHAAVAWAILRLLLRILRAGSRACRCWLQEHPSVQQLHP